MNTFPLAARAAIVIEYGEGSPGAYVGTASEDQSSLPVATSTASILPSITGTNTLPSYSAMPRLVMPQHAFVLRSAFGSYRQISLPVRAPTATVMLQLVWA
jgi:hypothetical protein